MIESKQASFRYQNTETGALKRVDLRIQPGECIVLCGKSGCGKTTFSRLLNGLIPSFFLGECWGEYEMSMIKGFIGLFV
ncbi:MAG: ATP-binding cassette domain-containing protein [Lachnospiraceae bacterium]|nr:ATP-binding cassette domain-containing protein [Lachnospiraceae bacterium]